MAEWEEANQRSFMQQLRTEAERYYGMHPIPSPDEWLAYVAFMGNRLTQGLTYDEARAEYDAAA
jgi:hypothetical protein